MVFFWVSVATTWALSPSRWAAAKSPRSDVDTFRSLIWSRSPPRSMWTRRTSALPYWLVPNVMAMALSRGLAGRILEFFDIEILRASGLSPARGGTPAGTTGEGRPARRRPPPAGPPQPRSGRRPGAPRPAGAAAAGAGTGWPARPRRPGWGRRGPGAGPGRRP